MKIPENMKCVVIQDYGAADKLKLVNCKLPIINNHEVLIKVKAIGVNRPDIMQRKGYYVAPKGASSIPGLEVSGKIVKVGNKVKGIKINDKVCALTHGGGYAEFCKVNQKHVLHIPKGLNYIEAACIPENFFTVWYNMFHIGKIKKNESVLIHGGSSGIGTIAIQMAKLINCKVFVTAGSKNKLKKCLEIGADYAINYKKENFEKKILAITKNKGINLILDMTGKEYFNRNLKLLTDKGRLIIIAYLTGRNTSLDLQQIIKKRLIISGSTLRPRTNYEKGFIARNIKKHYWSKLEEKKIKPYVYKVFQLKKVIQAHKLMESSKHIGKIVMINDNKEK